jgi:hypothetical protein
LFDKNLIGDLFVGKKNLHHKREDSQRSQCWFSASCSMYWGKTRSEHLLTRGLRTLNKERKDKQKHSNKSNKQQMEAAEEMKELSV